MQIHGLTHKDADWYVDAGRVFWWNGDIQATVGSRRHYLSAGSRQTHRAHFLQTSGRTHRGFKLQLINYLYRPCCWVSKTSITISGCWPGAVGLACCRRLPRCAVLAKNLLICLKCRYRFIPRSEPREVPVMGYRVGDVQITGTSAVNPDLPKVFLYMINVS